MHPVPNPACLRFSVVVPARNEELNLPAVLRSIAAQDFRGGVEVVVVDNGSTDRTALVAAEHGAAVVHEPRVGVCCARQSGTAAARGEIVVSTDADTVHPSTWLSAIDRSFRSGPDCVAVAGPCAYPDGPWWAEVYPRVLFGLVWLVSAVTGWVGYATATNLAFRRDAWPGYDTRLTQGGDELDLLRRLRRRGRVTFDLHNAVQTSARRLDRGFAHALVVTFGYQYAVAYLLNRLLRRPLVGTAPPAAEHCSRARSSGLRLALGVATVGVFATLFRHGGEGLADVVRDVVLATVNWR